ncbi:glycoside hydrolase family 92 protein [Leifsonia sp. ku-ls]|nr:glycoside hydrolase family 92 protein [Leifsonia sp. ku-ls]
MPLPLTVPAGEGEAALGLDLLGGRRILPDEELEWVYTPIAGAARYAATAFAVDLVFDDGSRLSELAVDQYGVPLTPEAQAAAKMLWVDQENLRRVDLAVAVGRTVERTLVRFGGPRVGAVRGILGSLRVRPARRLGPRPLDAVVATRGSRSTERFSRGNTAPLVASPHGAVFGLPMTDASSATWPYRADHDAIQAFATSHLPSPWIGDRGVFQVMPSPLSRPDADRSARALAFERDTLEDRAHLHRLRLEGGIEAELTAAGGAVAMRFRFPGAHGAIILDHLGAASDVVRRPTADGFRVDARLDDGPGRPAHHVAVAVTGAVTGNALTWRPGSLRGHLTVDTTATPVVDVVIGTSTIDAAQAASTLAGAGGFDDVLRRSTAEWEQALDVLELDGASDEQRSSLFSDLYRLFLYPNAYAEDGRYRSPVTGEVRRGPYSANNGFWDTYRTCWPALALLAPERAAALADGFVEHFRDAGWTSRWSAPGPVDSMTGTTSDTVFAGLAECEAPGLPLDDAYRSALKNATVPSPDPAVGRKGLETAIFRGYTASDLHEGLSWTLDNAINDASVARMARRRAETVPAGCREAERLATEERYFAHRALAYRRVFHRGLGFFLGRRPDGAWRVDPDDYDPRVWGYDYTETNGWGTAFTAPHDGAGLAALHGGEEALGRALDRFFAEPETADERFCGSYGFVIHEMAEAREVRMGMLGLSNQPAHHIPFMYSFAGRHDDAHRIVVEARDRLFVGTDHGQGFPGDEDNGEMSGWHLFASLGFYPLVPASGSYVLVPPAVRRARLRLPGGTLEVTADRPGARHIRRVTLDGVEWSHIAIPHRRLARGGWLAFELDDEPHGWAANTRPPSFSEEFGVEAPLRDLLRPGHPLTDDRGATRVDLAAGESVDLPLDSRAEAVFSTVTLAEPGVASWLLEGVDADGRWRELDRRDEESFAWPRQTRPFALHASAAGLVAVRLTAVHPLSLLQVELLGVG